MKVYANFKGKLRNQAKIGSTQGDENFCHPSTRDKNIRDSSLFKTDKGMFYVVVAVANNQFFLQDFDPEKRKMISRTLRFIAHSNGAHLQVSKFIFAALSRYVMSPVLKRF